MPNDDLTRQCEELAAAKGGSLKVGRQPGGYLAKIVVPADAEYPDEEHVLTGSGNTQDEAMSKLLASAQT
jgi:hypothetical protein